MMESFVEILNWIAEHGATLSWTPPTASVGGALVLHFMTIRPGGKSTELPRYQPATIIVVTNTLDSAAYERLWAGIVERGLNEKVT